MLHDIYTLCTFIVYVGMSNTLYTYVFSGDVTYSVHSTFPKLG